MLHVQRMSCLLSVGELSHVIFAVHLNHAQQWRLSYGMLGAHLNPDQQGIPLLVSLISGCSVLQRGQQHVAMQWHYVVNLVFRPLAALQV
jgi:hypothetical protein